MRSRARGLAAALLLAGSAVPLRAQAGAGRRSGEIQGTVTDSVRARPAAGAMVLLTRLAPEPPEFRSAVTDEKGRYRFDTLSAGRYTIAFETGYLDSLQLTLPPREVVLGDGERSRVDFAVPSGTTLRAAACPGLTIPKGQGAVVGQVTDADSGEPLSFARVVVSWTDLALDKATFQPASTVRTGAISADTLGRYRLCGVPTDTYLLIQVQHDGRVGSTVSVTVGDEGGVSLLELSLSRQSSRSLAELDSIAQVPGADTIPPKPLSGTATLTGVVRGSSGQPLSDAQLRVVDATGTARTDSLGRFTLTGQPSGTQLLETRRVGYLLSRTPVELRGGRTVEILVDLHRIVNLDSIRVVARRSRYRDFERRAGHSAFGFFLDEQKIDERHAFEASDLLQMVPGFRIVGSGIDSRIVSSRGAISFSGSCATNIVIDGIQHQEINLIHPSDIGALEAYPSPAGAPLMYDAACGVVVIWTKR